MHLLGFYNLVEISLTSSPPDVTSYTSGCQHPLTNAKVRRKKAMMYTTFG
jgi:hypothetical protein